MSTVFTHAFAGAAIGRIGTPGKMSAKIMLLSIGCAVIADADVIGFSFGIPYLHLLGHRGITHSFAFAAFTALIAVSLCRREIASNAFTWQRLLLTFFFAGATHPLLDAMTRGGYGVAMFAPFDNDRYFLPWRPIQASYFSIARFFTGEGLLILWYEMMIVWLPLIAILGIVQLLRYCFRATT